jgi:malate dehydrogenase (oxaloacetate-decarboxylating)
MTLQQEALDLHEKHKGKLETKSKIPLKDKKDLSLVYTPGVAAVSLAVAKNKKDVYKYTIKGNCVAVISDGSAVLGLGNIGPEGAIPVMEGKAILFKELANIDAWPICLASQDIQTTITTVRNIAPVFGGINLEDFKAPECFVIEAALQDLGIPVMHDDQHGTAVVVLAGLLNALKVVKKDIKNIKIAMSGAGAAGTAVVKLLIHCGVKGENVLMCDTKGIISQDRPDIANIPHKAELARLTNAKKLKGTIADAIKGADVFIGVSAKNLLTKEMVKSMAKSPIIFALANPDSEILPDEAKAAGAAVIATGRSDFPNQVNNSLGFPGIFRGALDVKATRITTEMKVAAAYALANLVKKPTSEQILPNALDKAVVPAVSEAVKKAWKP